MSQSLLFAGGARLSALTLAVACAWPAHAAGRNPSPTSNTDPAVAELRRQMDEMRSQYEARLKALEDKLATQANASANAPPTAAMADATGAEPAVASASPPASNNSFNPAVSVILSGTYASLRKDPGTWALRGFLPSGDEIGPGERGFSLGESEVGLSANIDPWLFGSLVLSVAGDNTIAAEEAFVQTTALPNGLKVKAGRFFAGLGYLNEQHAHTWDFVDAPLAYQAFLGGQYKQDGVQAKWLLPTEQFVELGAELGSGTAFPGSARNRNGAGTVLLSAHTGGDIGSSHNWRAGFSWMRNRANDRTFDLTDTSGADSSNAFTGTSRLWVLDGVWKWAPNGNATRTNFKLQGEYFRRLENGQVTYQYDATNAGAGQTDAYRSAQSGWYLQGIYQFMPNWRVGLRHDRLNSGTTDFFGNSGNLALAQATPQRDSLMVDWSPSEFSRWRLQLSNDRARDGSPDRQLFLQYQTSLGSHGAHSY